MHCLLPALIILIIQCASGLSNKPALIRNTLKFPVVRSGASITSNEESARKIKVAFNKIVDSTDFFVHDDNDRNTMCCRVPLFGETIKVSLKQNDEADAYVLTVEGDSLSKHDFGWICVKFYECRGNFDGLLDVSDNRFPLSPGVDAEQAKLAGTIQQLFQKDATVLTKLKRDGYVVVDQGGPQTTPATRHLLTKYLQTKSRQSDSVRTDMMHFLSRTEAVECEMSGQYDTLMGIASYLNENYEFGEAYGGGGAPIAPATEDKPLTNPSLIQLAEYRQGGFYKAHADNTVNDDGKRTNYREFTAILYCNDDWDKPEYGGALRLYKSSQGVVPSEAVKSCTFVDILPSNGRLILFDSHLVHSVQPNNHPTQVRRALTLWIMWPY